MALHIPAIPRRINLPKTLPTDLPSALRWIKDLSQALNDQNDLIAATMTGMQGADVIANRPKAAIQGRTYLATDVGAHGTLYVDDGTNWHGVAMTS